MSIKKLLSSTMLNLVITLILAILLCPIVWATTAISESNISIANNPVGTFDEIQVSGLTSGDIVRVYTTSAKTSVLVAKTFSTAYGTIYVYQIGTSAGTVYVTVQNKGGTESTTTSKAFSAEPLTSAPVVGSTGNLVLTNNITGSPDTITVTGINSGDILRVYSAAKGGNPTAVAYAEGTSATIYVNQFGADTSGKVYVSLQTTGKCESSRTSVSYDKEPITTPIPASNVTVTNYYQKDDSIAVSGLAEGDTITVYRALSGGTAIASAIATANANSVLMSIAEIGSIKGSIYVSLQNNGKRVSKTRTKITYSSDASVTAIGSNIAIANNYIGTDDTITVSGLAEGDIVKVYSKSTLGTAIGSAIVTASSNSAIVSISELGSAGFAGTAYITLTKTNTRESGRVAKPFGSEPRSAAISTSVITIANNSDISDTITVTGLSDDDTITVYRAKTGGTAIASASCIASSGGSTVVSITQIGTGSGTLYITNKGASKRESSRVAKPYGSELTTTALSTSSIDVLNYEPTYEDTITVTGLSEGDVIKAYKAQTGGTAVGSAICTADSNSAVISIANLGTNAGKIYVSVKQTNKRESTRANKAYASEVSTALTSDSITIVNNYVGTNDTITVVGLSEGDTIKVYSASTGGNAIGSAVVTAGSTGAVVSVDQIKSAGLAGSAYISLTKYKKRESSRIAKPFGSEPKTNALSESAITIANNAGSADTVTVTGLAEGDIISVYGTATTSTVMGTAIVTANSANAVLSISQLGTGAGTLYITNKNTGKAESTRTSKAYSAE